MATQEAGGLVIKEVHDEMNPVIAIAEAALEGMMTNVATAEAKLVPLADNPGTIEVRNAAPECDLLIQVAYHKTVLEEVSLAKVEVKVRVL